MGKDAWTLDKKRNAGWRVYYAQTHIHIVVRVRKWYLGEDDKPWPWFAAARHKQELPLAPCLGARFLSRGGGREMMGSFSAFGDVSLALMKVTRGESIPHWPEFIPLVAGCPSQGAVRGWGSPGASLWGGQVAPSTQKPLRGQLPFPELLPEKQEPNLHVLVLQLLIMPCTRP